MQSSDGSAKFPDCDRGSIGWKTWRGEYYPDFWIRRGPSGSGLFFCLGRRHLDVAADGLDQRQEIVDMKFREGSDMALPTGST